VGLCLAAGVLGIGLAPFSDNSFFTHLATGRLIVDQGHIPTTDPYTFTAHGHGWVVQSWLVSALLGVVDDVAGIGGVRILVGLLTVGVFAVAWRLSRPAQGLVVRVGIAGLVIGVGSLQWSERPLLVGLIAMGLAVLAGEGELDPRWLLPLGWVWVNSHGSFPIGIAYLLVVALGRRLDHLDASVELRAFRWLTGGVLLGAINPLGPKLLVFPVQLLQHQDVLRHVTEWQAPQFHDLGERIFLLQVGLAILALVRRPRYRNALVVAVFVAAALLGARNEAVASLVLVPVLAEAWSNVGGLKASTREGISRLLAVAGVVLVAAVAMSRLGQPAFDVSGYPVASLDQLDEWKVDLQRVHLASIDQVGNLIELRDGPGRRVWFDDRFDMFPEAVTRDAFALNDARPRSLEVLDHRGIDLVLWPSEGGLTAVLSATDEWRDLDDSDDGWRLFCRVGAPLGGTLGTC
jgi:hypothetical protein